MNTRSSVLSVGGGVTDRGGGEREKNGARGRRHGSRAIVSASVRRDPVWRRALPPSSPQPPPRSLSVFVARRPNVADNGDNAGVNLSSVACPSPSWEDCGTPSTNVASARSSCSTSSSCS